MNRARTCRVLWSRFRYDVEKRLSPQVLIVIRSPQDALRHIPCGRGKSVRSDSSNYVKEVRPSALPAGPWLWHGWVDRRLHHCITIS